MGTKRTRRKKSALEQIAEGIRRFKGEAESQLDYEAHKVIIDLLRADTLEEFRRIKENTPKDVRNRVADLAETKYTRVFWKLDRLARLSEAHRKENKISFLSDCLNK